MKSESFKAAAAPATVSGELPFTRSHWSHSLREGGNLAVRDSLFVFLEHPEAPPDNNGSERDLRPMVVYRKVTGGFRSAWGPDLCAAVKSVVGTAARRGIDAYHAIHAVLSGRTVLAPS